MWGATVCMMMISGVPGFLVCMGFIVKRATWDWKHFTACDLASNTFLSIVYFALP